MTTVIVFCIVVLLVIAATEHLGETIGLVTPVVLLAVGVGLGFLPNMPDVVIEPEVVIAGILPPLLYSAAVGMPGMDFQRNLGPIATLSVALVAGTALAVGLVLTVIVPWMGLATAIAIGAILSPTDAVATSIARRLGLSDRVIAVLEGEGLINDASALVILSAAIAASTATVSLTSVWWDFLWTAGFAVVSGWVVGEIIIRIRRHITSTTTDTVVSLTTPFLAFLLAEHFGASGLVAVVVAGLVTGHHAPQTLPPSHRAATRQTWVTLALVLEGVVFLIMGMELSGLLHDLGRESAGVGESFPQLVKVAGVLLGIIIVIRVVVVTSVLRIAALSARGRAARRQRLDQRLDGHDAFARLQTSDAPGDVNPDRNAGSKNAGSNNDHKPGPFARGARRPRRINRHQRFQWQLDRMRADLAYYEEARLGWREGAVIVWSGMRGAVSLAAAQTLPLHTPHRAYLIILVFVVSAASLVVQGESLGLLVHLVRPARAEPPTPEQWRQLRALMRHAALSVPVPAELHSAMDDFCQRTAMEDMMDDSHDSVDLDEFQALSQYTSLRQGEDQMPADSVVVDDMNRRLSSASAVLLATRMFETLGRDEQDSHLSWDLAQTAMRYAIAVIEAKRRCLLHARDKGLFPSGLLSDALRNLDADQISLELRAAPVDE